MNFGHIKFVVINDNNKYDFKILIFCSCKYLVKYFFLFFQRKEATYKIT